MRLGDMHWVLCNSACLICGELMLLFLYMIVGSGLLLCFVVLALEDDVAGLRSIVSVYDWGSHLVRGLCLVLIYQ